MARIEQVLFQNKEGVCTKITEEWYEVKDSDGRRLEFHNISEADAISFFEGLAEIT